MQLLSFKHGLTVFSGGLLTAVLLAMLWSAYRMDVYPQMMEYPLFFGLSILGVLACWAFLSLLIHRFSLGQVVVVVSLFVAGAVGNLYLEGPFNAVTIPMLTLFWLGITYFVVPDFFKKYAVAILSVYGAVLSYFFVFRATANYAEVYHPNFLRFLIVPIPVLAGLWVYEQWRWLKALRADKTKAELTLLKNQINPHFFFNTLNNLYGLAIEKSDAAPAMILKLSDIMRYTIYDGEKPYVPLAAEINYLKDYIELHRIRYHRAVDITFTEDCEYQHAIAPLLLIAPLENAFKHGVERQPGRAEIAVIISTTPASIHYRVSNTYEGAPAVTGGIGLKNLRQRLALIYPERHLINVEDTGTTFTLSLEIKPG